MPSPASTRSELRFLAFLALFLPACVQGVAAAGTATDDGSGGASLARVEVTGSHLAQDASAQASPLQVITAGDIQRSGAASIAEVLERLAANGMGTLTQANPGADAAGAAGIALRGLTVGATLVLVDGHRMAPYPLPDDGQRDFVDLASLPMSSVERIEVLKDGASAIYGSDAIAGVVNVVLKHHVHGDQLDLQGGSTARGDGRSRQLALLHGYGDEQAGHDGYFSLEYAEQSAILLSSRSSLARTDWRAWGGQNLALGVPNAVNGNAASGSASGILIDPATGLPGSYLGRCMAQAAAAGGCAYTDPQLQVQPATRQVSAMLRDNLALTDEWSLSLQAGWQRSVAEQIGPYNSLDGGTGVPLLAFGPDTPLAAAAGSGFPAVLTLPAGSALNPYGRPAALVYDFTDVGATRSSTDARSSRLVADLDGRVDAWTLGIAAGLTRVVTTVDDHGYLDFPAAQAALDDGSYVPGGNNSGAVLARIAPTGASQASDTLDFIGVHGSREYAAGLAAPLGLAIGADWTARHLDDRFPDSFASGRQASPIYAFAIGGQRTVAAWGELALPLRRDLEATAALRYDHYDSGAGATSPKFSMRWLATPGLAVRMSHAGGFRAPNPREAGNSGSYVGVPNPVYDPRLCPGGSNPGGGNPNCVVFPVEVQLPGHDLRPERSRSWGAGLALAPAADAALTLDYYRITLDDMIVSPGLFGQSVVNDPAAFGATLVRDPASGALLYETFPFINAGRVQTSGVDMEGRLGLPWSGAGRLQLRLDWVHLLAYDLTLGGTTYHLAGTHGPSFVSGDTGNPRNRASLALDWRGERWTLEAGIDHIGSFGVTDPALGASTCASALAAVFAGAEPPAALCRVAAFDTVHVTGSVQLDPRTSLQFTVDNLFDHGPPVDLQTVGSPGNGTANGGADYNPALHQEGAVGRLFRVGLRFRW